MKYIAIIESEDNSNYINFNNSLIDKKFKINYSFPFIEYVINNILEEDDNGNKINTLEIKIREYIITELNKKIEIRKVWSFNRISNNIKNKKLEEIKNKTLNAIRYKVLEDICDKKPLNNSKFFYFYPENQNNYLLDSIILINHDDNIFSIIAFHITKFKTKDEIKFKNKFKNYLLGKIKPKFEELYGININSIHLWFILNNDNLENEITCKYLKAEKIKYIFYSIKKKYLFEENNFNKINNLLFFLNEEALIYSENNFYNDENKKMEIEPYSISIFENKLYNLSEIYETVNYEKIRKNYFKNNFGLKIEKQLRKEIIDKIKTINKYKNDFYFLFLFCFPYDDFYKYYNLNDELVFILKFEKIIFFYYKNNFFEIDCTNKKLKTPRKIQINIEHILPFKKEINYNEEEIDIFSIKDLKDNNIIYLYKLYFIDDLKN